MDITKRYNDLDDVKEYIEEQGKEWHWREHLGTDPIWDELNQRPIINDTENLK